MTNDDRDATDRLRRDIAGTLANTLGGWSRDYADAADALLPVARTYAADQLDAAADEAVAGGYILRLDNAAMFDVLTSEQLRARAAALRNQP